MKEYDYLIVGSGLYGATFAYLAKQNGKKCLILEKRNIIGGNLYCENIDGITVHKYGPHIFHTSNKEVWNLVTSLVPFNNFRLNTLANYKDKLYNLPFNMNTFYQIWGIKEPYLAQRMIDEQRYHNTPKNLAEQAKSLVGDDVFNILIKGYTEKQWGKKCEELPCEIIKRLPVRLTYDNNYFNDTYQGIPIGGYNELIKKLTEGVEIHTNTDYLANKEYFNSLAEKIVYTGKIDEYFNYLYGELEYRTVYWKEEELNIPNFQGNAIINYTDINVPYTRIIEHKHFDTFNDKVYDNNKTIISYEYSTQWKKGMEGYYPINNSKNNEILEKYKELANNEQNLIFGGRLAEYKYYDMDDTIEQVLKTIKENI